MKDISLSRRAVMLGVAALPMAQKAVASRIPPPPNSYKMTPGLMVPKERKPGG